jgi:hypothetical protein
MEQRQKLNGVTRDKTPRETGERKWTDRNWKVEELLEESEVLILCLKILRTDFWSSVEPADQVWGDVIVLDE